MLDHVRRASYLAALITLAAAGPARADALPRPPEDCPLGSQGSGLHCGMYCFALVCMKHSDCEDGATCQALEACIRTADCFQNTPPVLGGPCSPGGTCLGEGETCQTIKVCLPGEGSTSDDSGASSTTGTHTTGTHTAGTTDAATTTGETTGGATTTAGNTTTGVTTTGATTTSATTTSAASTASATEAAPTSGGMPSTSGATTTGGPGSATGGGSGDGTGGGGKGGCSGCTLVDGPPGVLGLMLVVGLARRRRVRP